MTYGNGGARACSPSANIRQAGQSLSAAAGDLWEAPGKCGPDSVPLLLSDSLEAAAALARVLACLSASDLDPARREQLSDVNVAMAGVMTGLKSVCQAPA